MEEQNFMMGNAKVMQINQSVAIIIPKKIAILQQIQKGNFVEFKIRRMSDFVQPPKNTGRPEKGGFSINDNLPSEIVPMDKVE